MSIAVPLCGTIVPNRLAAEAGWLRPLGRPASSSLYLRKPCPLSFSYALNHDAFPDREIIDSAADKIDDENALKFRRERFFSPDPDGISDACEQLDRRSPFAQSVNHLRHSPLRVTGNRSDHIALIGVEPSS